LAREQGRLVVTYNHKDFRSFADKSVQSEIIGISANLSPSQIDTKLVALLRNPSQKNLYGGFNFISGKPADKSRTD